MQTFSLELYPNIIAVTEGIPNSAEAKSIQSHVWGKAYNPAALSVVGAAFSFENLATTSVTSSNCTVICPTPCTAAGGFASFCEEVLIGIPASQCTAEGVNSELGNLACATGSAKYEFNP
jgi:hypothetical protein